LSFRYKSLDNFKLKKRQIRHIAQTSYCLDQFEEREKKMQSDNVVAHTVGSVGHSALFITAFCMLFSAACFYGYALQVKPSHCLLQSICMGICGFAGVAYAIMTLGHGYAMVDGRPFYYIRYVDWIITTPLLLYDICKIGGCPKAQIVLLTFLDIFMILFGMLSGLVRSWTLFIFGCILFIPILIALCGGLSKQASKAPADVRSVLVRLCALTATTWIVYPLVWIVCEGLNIGSVDTEIVIYAILDVLSKCGFGFILCMQRSAIEKVAKMEESFGNIKRASDFNLEY